MMSQLQLSELLELRNLKQKREFQKPYVLKLSSPITVVANGGDEFNETETNQRTIQMAPSEEHINYLKSRNAYGKRIQVTGTFFHSHTGHHFTPVLMTVSEVKNFKLFSQFFFSLIL